MASKSCVICGSEESEGELLLEAPCGRHWVCSDDIGSYFENATNNESLYPPKCCGQMFILSDYEDYVPFDVQWAYRVKERGEYATLAKFRVYCANAPCAKFLHPEKHIEDPDTKITFAICDAENCGKQTCVQCKTLIEQGPQKHECAQDEDEKKFKKTATEKGYQECFVCGATVELAEACNHITCGCGNSFCYICGENWPGLHGCPHYGPAVYDEEGYNQDGFHRDTGLNRAGLTRRQDILRARAQAGEDEDPDDEDDEDDIDGEDPDWEVLQHLDPVERAMLNQLPNGIREDALDQFRIDLFENAGILFNQGHPQPPVPQGHEDDDDPNDEDGDRDEDEDDEGDQLAALVDAEEAERAQVEIDDMIHTDSDSDSENHDPLDDEENTPPLERFADDQSEDNVSDDAVPEPEFNGSNTFLRDVMIERDDIDDEDLPLPRPWNFTTSYPKISLKKIYH